MIGATEVNGVLSELAEVRRSPAGRQIESGPGGAAAHAVEVVRTGCDVLEGSLLASKPVEQGIEHADRNFYLLAHHLLDLQHPAGEQGARHRRAADVLPLASIYRACGDRRKVGGSCEQGKVGQVATGAITQFFFDNDVYFRFLDRVRASGITIPIVPGLIPIHNFRQIAGFATRSGATMPDWLGRRFEGLDQDQETRHLVAAAVAAEQVLGLVDHGITEFHFYTLNRADLIYAICHLLGIRPVPAQAKTEAAS